MKAFKVSGVLSSSLGADVGIPFRSGSDPRIVSLVILLLLSLAAGCAFSPESPSARANPPVPIAKVTKYPAGAPADPHSHAKLMAVHWMQEAAEYKAVCEQTFALAIEALDRNLADTRVSALPSNGSDPVVIVDLDETILDNGPYQAHLTRNGVEFSDPSWDSWVPSGQVRFMPGAEDFLRHALHAPGVRVFYVSNRSDPTNRPATLASLSKIDPKLASEPERLLLLEKGASSDKTQRRSNVAAKYRVVLLVGDDLADFVAVPRVGQDNPVADVVKRRGEIVDAARAQWGKTWFILPNPAYGSWARVYALPDAESTYRLRLDRLRVWIP